MWTSRGCKEKTETGFPKEWTVTVGAGLSRQYTGKASSELFSPSLLDYRLAHLLWWWTFPILRHWQVLSASVFSLEGSSPLTYTNMQDFWQIFKYGTPWWDLNFNQDRSNRQNELRSNGRNHYRFFTYLERLFPISLRLVLQGRVYCKWKGFWNLLNSGAVITAALFLSLVSPSIKWILITLSNVNAVSCTKHWCHCLVHTKQKKKKKKKNMCQNYWQTD